jgi:hypothetical protein
LNITQLGYINVDGVELDLPTVAGLQIGLAEGVVAA